MIEVPTNQVLCDLATQACWAVPHVGTMARFLLTARWVNDGAFLLTMHAHLTFITPVYIAGAATYQFVHWCLS